MPIAQTVKPLPPEDLAHVLEHTRDLWFEASGKSFFITGGTGFFGMWLLESFAYINDQLALGMQATILTRDSVAFAGKAPHLAVRADLQFIQGDIRSFPFPEGEFSHVIHAAVDYCAPLELFTNNVEGARRTLDFAVKAGASRYLLTSSGAVYGPQPPEITHVSESYSGAPDTMMIRSAYGEAKRASEFLCAAYHERFGIETTIARCFAFVGPHLPLNSNYAIGNFIQDALLGGPIRIQGDGTPRRSYLYAADLTICLWTLLFKGRVGRAYNVGSEDEFSIEQIAHLVAETVNRETEILIATEPKIGQPCLRYLPSIHRAKSELGLSALINVRESIRRTVDWYRKLKT